MFVLHLKWKKVRKEPILIWRCVIFFVLVAPSEVYVKNYFFWKICAHRIVHSQWVKTAFLFGFRLYIHSDMIALTSEYHLHARNSLLTEINRCRLGQKRHIRGVICGFVNNSFFGKNVHIKLCTLKCIKTAFLFSLWPHMHLNMITLASV